MSAPGKRKFENGDGRKLETKAYRASKDIEQANGFESVSSCRETSSRETKTRDAWRRQGVQTVEVVFRSRNVASQLIGFDNGRQDEARWSRGGLKLATGRSTLMEMEMEMETGRQRAKGACNNGDVCNNTRRSVVSGNKWEINVRGWVRGHAAPIGGMCAEERLGPWICVRGYSRT